jgi:hypothetical protein
MLNYREIIFKGRDIPTGKWVEGDLNHLGDSIHISPLTDGCITSFTYDVDPKTVSQFTNKKDVDGVKIFDGDKVKVTVNLPTGDKDDMGFKNTVKKETIWTIEWVDFQTYCGWRCYGEDRRFNIKLSSSTIFNNNLKVIGSKHDG